MVSRFDLYQRECKSLQDNAHKCTQGLAKQSHTQTQVFDLHQLALHVLLLEITPATK